MSDDGNTIDLAGPVTVTAELARALARTLVRSYPDVTAGTVAADLARPEGGGRGIIGLFAAGSLEDAIEQGVVGPDAEGVLGVKA